MTGDGAERRGTGLARWRARRTPARVRAGAAMMRRFVPLRAGPGPERASARRAPRGAVHRRDGAGAGAARDGPRRPRPGLRLDFEDGRRERALPRARRRRAMTPGGRLTGSATMEAWPSFFGCRRAGGLILDPGRWLTRRGAPAPPFRTRPQSIGRGTALGRLIRAGSAAGSGVATCALVDRARHHGVTRSARRLDGSRPGAASRAGRCPSCPATAASRPARPRRAARG